MSSELEKDINTNRTVEDLVDLRSCPVFELPKHPSNCLLVPRPVSMIAVQDNVIGG